MKKLRENGLRASLDDSDRTLEYKIREAQMKKVPYMLVIGKKEEESKTVTIRARSGSQKQGVKLDEFIEKITKEIAERNQSLSY